ncbi:MAG: hypothetical protein DDT26_00831 [Dehalococcoidia bacterium]|nr:hypothetical protein [Chloroflexota bacterium]
MPRKAFSIRLDDDIALVIATYASEHLCTQTEAHMRLLRAGIAAAGGGTLADRVSALERGLDAIRAQVEMQPTQSQRHATTPASGRVTKRKTTAPTTSHTPDSIVSELVDPTQKYPGPPATREPLPPDWGALPTKRLKELGRGRIIDPSHRTKAELLLGISTWQQLYSEVV